MNDADFRDLVRYLNTMSTVSALWWFIENVGSDHPRRTDLFFYCRERFRKDQSLGGRGSGLGPTIRSM